jgi:hypothetical protein
MAARAACSHTRLAILLMLMLMLILMLILILILILSAAAAAAAPCRQHSCVSEPPRHVWWLHAVLPSRHVT